MRERTKRVIRPLQSLGFSRFDQAALAMVLALTLVAALLAARGDQAGIRIVRIEPEPRATDVSTRATLRIILNQPISKPGPGRILVFEPAIEGSLRWSETELAFSPSTSWDADTVYTVTLAPGIIGDSGSTLLHGKSWQFRTGRPRIAYLANDSRDKTQIYVTAPQTGSSLQLTREPFGVWDYAVSPTGRTLVYSAIRADGERELWSVQTDGRKRRLLIGSREFSCSNPVWHPDEKRLLYERQTNQDGRGPIGAPQLWWLDVDNGDTQPLLAQTQALGYGARFSADGQWLSYNAPDEQSIVALRLRDGLRWILSNAMGTPSVWRPQHTELLVEQIEFRGERYVAHLIRWQPESAVLVNISGDGWVEDGSAAWSPDGQQIAFTRSVLEGADALPGKQVWLVDLDGSQVRPLTTEPGVHHASPVWSPDGRYLLYFRNDIRQTDRQGAIMLADLGTDGHTMAIVEGNWPAWIP